MELQTFTFQFCTLLVWSANGDAPFQGKFQVNLLNDDTSDGIVRRHPTTNKARTQDFEKGGSEYRVAVRPRRGGGCGKLLH